MIGALVRFRMVTCLRSWACWPVVVFLLISAAWPWLTHAAGPILESLEMRSLPYDPAELLEPTGPDSQRDMRDLVEVFNRHRVATQIGAIIAVFAIILGTLTLGFACREQLASSAELFAIAPHPVRSIVLSEFAGTLGGVLLMEMCVLPMRVFFFALSAQPIWLFALNESLLVGSAAIAAAIVSWAERAPSTYLLATRLFRGSLATVVLLWAAVRVPAGGGDSYERVAEGWGRFFAFPAASSLEALLDSYASPLLAVAAITAIAVGLVFFFLFDAAREREEIRS